MESPSEIAVARMKMNFNCAQAVLVAFAPQLGLDEKQALRMASPLGGGVARRGQVCGALTGALLALGLAKGSDTPAGKEDAYRMGKEFLERFEATYDTILCWDLLDCDISTPEGLQEARDRGLFSSLCPAFVREAAKIVEDMLAENA
jgi:C_GCAxxG_C_C family probable redox protein